MSDIIWYLSFFFSHFTDYDNPLGWSWSGRELAPYAFQNMQYLWLLAER